MVFRQSSSPSTVTCKARLLFLRSVYSIVVAIIACLSLLQVPVERQSLTGLVDGGGWGPSGVTLLQHSQQEEHGSTGMLADVVPDNYHAHTGLISSLVAHIVNCASMQVELEDFKQDLYFDVPSLDKYVRFHYL